jgi:integrase
LPGKGAPLPGIRPFGKRNANRREYFPEPHLGMTEKVVRQFAAKAGIDTLAPHDLRRTSARLCHGAEGEMEQIQFRLGHVSIQTTERYLGGKNASGRP